MKLGLKKKLVSYTGKVKSVDFHPTFNWILLGLFNGSLSIYDYITQSSIQYIEVTLVPIRTAKFMPEKNYIICGSDDKLIRIYNYNTMEKVSEFEAHTDFIRSIIIHYKEPLFATCSDDGTINLYDAGNSNNLIRTYNEHTDYVMKLAVNPKDYNMFASASMDKKIKIWSFTAANSQLTLEGHRKGIGALAFCPLYDKPYLASGSDDFTIKIWDYTTKQCIYTLSGHEGNLSALCFHQELPILISGSEDNTCKFWNINTSKLEDSKLFGYDCIWDIAAQHNDNLVAFGCDEATLVMQVGNEDPLITFSQSQSKIIYSSQNTIYSINIKQIQHTYNDGEIISISPKELGHCEVYPNAISYSQNGKYVYIFSNKEYIISPSGVYRSSVNGSCSSISWNDADSYIIKEGSSVKLYKELKEVNKFKPDFYFDQVFGGPLIGIKSEDAIFFYDTENFIMIRKIDVVPKKVVWNEKCNLVALITEDGTYILKANLEKIAFYIDNIAEGVSKENENGCEESFDVYYDINDDIINGFFYDDIFIYQTTKNKINYSIKDKNFNFTTLSSKFFLLGYLPFTNHLYLMNKQFNLISYHLPKSFLDYQLAIINSNFEEAENILKKVPSNFIEKLIQFLEKFNFYEICYSISNNNNHKFSLAIKLKKLEDAWNIAKMENNNEKMKLVSDLAMELGEFSYAEKAMLAGNDFPGLLLYYSSIQDRNKLLNLADISKNKGIYNVAYTCYFQLNDLNNCLNLLIDTKRYPEAALFCRTYCPSKLENVLNLWNELIKSENESQRMDIKVVNPINDDCKDIFNDIEMFNDLYYDKIKNASFDDLTQYLQYLNLDVVSAIKKGGKEEIEKLFK